MAEIRARVYTDPACPWSWAAEPAMRLLEVQFAGQVAITYVMGGLAREFGRPAETMRHWIDACAASGMPGDPRLWLDAPPRSSYPACLAAKAAAEQGLDAPFLHRVRRGMAVERRRLDGPESLTEVARDVDGLDVDRFVADLDSSAIVESLGADLQETRETDAPGRGDAPRISFPSLRVEGPGGEHWAYDSWDPAAWRAAAVAAGAEASATALEPVAALRAHGPLATPEVAALCDQPGPTAPARLWALAAEHRVTVTRHASGETWAAA